MRKIASDEGLFRGWPANHGHWQRGSEWLFGFIEGAYDAGDAARMHRVTGSLIKRQARSLDGGATWALETPNVDFEGDLPESGILSFDENTIARFCGRYDHGGEFCFPRGAVYLSNDFGREWRGPYFLHGSEMPDELVCTTRTCMVGDIAFLSFANWRQWGSDFVVVARFHDGKLFYVSEFGHDAGVRCVMPAAVRIGHEILVACRRRRDRECWVDLFTSYDNGNSWISRGFVGSTGTHNGNPPALLALGNYLVCAYGVRDSNHPCMQLKVSQDRGISWEPFLSYQCPTTDLGYPVLFGREKNSGSVVWYQDCGVSAKRSELVIADFVL